MIPAALARAFAAVIVFTAVFAAARAQPGQDLRLSYRSLIDGTEQPFRVYVPSNYSADRAIPVVVVLHQTGDDENDLFDDEVHYPSRHGVKNAAELHGLLAVSPRGRGTTEYRGIGENDVFCVLAEVKARFHVDDERIYLTGHSMGGTGSAYLALHHPDQFAAIAPLAAAYSHPWLAANAGHVPFRWISGANDADYYKDGVAQGVARMRRLGCPVEYVELPGEGHYGPARDFRPVFEWLVRHRLVRHPPRFTFEVDSPLHPRAYWITVEEIGRPGRIARVTAAAASPTTARLDLENVRSVAFWPDPALFSAGEPLELSVDGVIVFRGTVSAGHEVVAAQDEGRWRTFVRRRRELSLTAFRTHPVAHAPETLDMSGTEARLANWITDAMRAATGADVALYNRRHYRGLPLAAGTVDVVDLVQCSRPFDQYLVMVELTGREIVEILEANVQGRDAVAKAGAASNLLVQLSGGRYSFNREMPAGRRIVASSFEPGRRYRVVLEGQVVQRETMRLAGRFKEIEYRSTGIPFSSALYGYAAASAELRATIEGRVVEVR